MIRLSNVSKRFGERLAVDSLSLHVPAGEIYGLLGHNGAGKSTAIGMMLGQVWPSAGTVAICDYDVARHRAAALRQVGAIFESPAFYDYLSGLRNLEIFGSYSGPVSHARIREVLDWVGLSGRERSRVRTYSHGMRARLALAQALLPGPKLLILDEPSDGLDPEGIHEMRQMILRLRKELHLTILLSSHFLSEVEQLCTRIAVLNQGRLVFEGPIHATRRPNNWLRLEISEFERATAGLIAARLISTATPEQWVALGEEADASQVVRWLVQEGFAVHQVVRQEETLEQFYLRLMRHERQPSTSPQS